jgi:hypothetical protein
MPSRFVSETSALGSEIMRDSARLCARFARAGAKAPSESRTDAGSDDLHGQV